MLCVHNKRHLLAALFLFKISKGSSFFQDFKRRHPDRALSRQLDKKILEIFLRPPSFYGASEGSPTHRILSILEDTPFNCNVR